MPTLYIQLKKIQQTCTSNNHDYIKRGLIFPKHFTTNLLMQHEFYCANPIGLKLENMKEEPKQNNTHIP